MVVIRKLIYCAAGFVVACAAALLTTAPNNAAPPARERDAFQATHVVIAQTAYYKTSPAQGRPQDGEFSPGTVVQRVKKAGSYVQVKTNDGLVAFVAADALAPVAGKELVTPDVKTVAASINGFAFDLYAQVGQEGGNLFFSPASISTALAMALAGAEGKTEQEMIHVLQLDRNSTQVPPQRMHAAYGRLANLLNSGGAEGGYVLRMANRLWGHEAANFLPEFLTTTREHYGAELATLDFRDPESARREINQWVKEQTQDKIPELLPSGLPAPDTRLVLTNAIYFLGGWAEEFSERATERQPFFVTPEQPVEVPLMTQTEHFGYRETEDAQILALPYRGGEISMVVLLPKNADDFAAFETTLTADNVQQWTERLPSREVQVFLPKFQMTEQFSLKDALAVMGMPTAFTGAAEFTKMARDEQLMISEVIHKAFVDVNEKGTEAAAATAVILAPTAAPVEPEPPVVFRADHPFVFLIRDNRTGAILFLGRVTNPGM